MVEGFENKKEFLLIRPMSRKDLVQISLIWGVKSSLSLYEMPRSLVVLTLAMIVLPIE